MIDQNFNNKATKLSGYGKKLINYKEFETATGLLEPRRLSVFLMPFHSYGKVVCSIKKH